jgi:allantoicase
MTAETDLASRWLGGTVVGASDESFGEKENLLNPAPAAFEPGHYGPRGEVVDGWETRRRRSPGHDWVIVRLGAPGVITSVDVDTSFFTGNFPQAVSLEACGYEGYPGPDELTGPATRWEQIIPPTALTGDSHNLLTVTDPHRFTHVRLAAYPDGGIARLRVLGRVVPDPRGLEDLTIDLAGQAYGGAVVDTSDDFYTSAAHLNRPDQARTMGEGWETQRRRDGGHDHVLFGLAFRGVIRRIVVDTAHFRYNASAEVALRGSAQDPAQAGDPREWPPLLGRTRLQPDTRHEFASQWRQPVALVRLDAFPDGGLSRVRLIGSIEPAARRAAGYLWFNSLPVAQAIQCLLGIGLEPDLAAELAGQRPLTEAAPQGPAGHAGAAYQALASMLEGQPRLPGHPPKGNLAGLAVLGCAQRRGQQVIQGRALGGGQAPHGFGQDLVDDAAARTAGVVACRGDGVPYGPPGAGHALEQALVDHPAGQRAHRLVGLEGELRELVQRRIRPLMQVPEHVPLGERQPDLGQQPPVRLAVVPPLQPLHGETDVLERQFPNRPDHSLTLPH